RLEEWLGRKHGQVNFYLTRVLSGHGCFRGYLHRLGHTDSAACTWCADELDETAEHLVFACGRFVRERSQLEAHLDTEVSVDNLTTLMVASVNNWQAVSNFAAAVMCKLRTDERLRSG
ncbi:hypothetical protein KR054_003639, partial [Drosophila jambulina]